MRIALTAILLSIFFLATAQADILPPNMRPLNLCVSVEGLAEQPDMILVGVIRTMNDEFQATVVEEGDCLFGGYKFNKYYLYGLAKTDVDELDPKQLPEKLFPEELGQRMDVFGGYVDNDSTITRQHEVWTVEEWGKDTPLQLRKLRTDFYYEDGTVSTVEGKE